LSNIYKGFWLLKRRRQAFNRFERFGTSGVLALANTTRLSVPVPTSVPVPAPDERLILHARQRQRQINLSANSQLLYKPIVISNL